MISLGSLALGAGKLALGVGKGILGTATVGAKSGRYMSGARMASAIVKRQSKKGEIAKEQSKIKVKTKVVSVSSLMDTKSLKPESKKGSKKSSGVDSLDKVLDGIDNTLAGLLLTIRASSRLYKKENRRKNILSQREKRSKKEESLKKPNFGKIPLPFRSVFGSIQKFFSNILIGSLVVLILDNIDSIINSLKGVYNTVKDFISKVGGFLQPVWKVLKWIWPGNSPSGLEMVRAILGNKNTQDLMDSTKIKEVEDVYKQVEDQTKVLQGSFKDIEKETNDARIEGGETPISMNDVPPPPPIVQQETYNIPQMVQLLKSQGATDNEAIRLAAIGMLESSGNPKARNTKHPDNSYGLFQINMLDEPGYKLGEERREKYNIQNNDLLDPTTNARIALDILRTQGRKAWSTDSEVTPAQLEMGEKTINRLNNTKLNLGNQSSLKNLSEKVSSLRTLPSYSMGGNNTIIALDSGSQSSSTQSSGDSSPMVIPLIPSRKQVMLNNYEFSVNSALWKIG